MKTRSRAVSEWRSQTRKARARLRPPKSDGVVHYVHTADLMSRRTDASIPDWSSTRRRATRIPWRRFLILALLLACCLIWLASLLGP